MALNILCLCPRQRCQRGFLVFYVREVDAVGRQFGPWKLQTIAPRNPKEPDIPDEVRAISPAYVEIVSQAAAAESFELDEIAGVGYRKALEFLVKDYCIKKHLDKEEEIKAAFLGDCIENYVDDANVKRCARLATWLGNDETHYVRKWEGKDLKDLKRLMKLTEVWIVNVEVTDEYVRDMGG